VNSTIAFVLLGIVLAVIALLALIAFLRSRGADVPLLGGKGEYDGLLVLGPEQSSFTPCDNPDTSYWLVWANDVRLTEALAKLGFDSTYAEAHLRFDGTLETSGGSYGHMGRYPGQLQITKLYKAERKGRCD